MLASSLSFLPSLSAIGTTTNREQTMDNADLYAHANALQKRDAIIVLREFLPQLSWDNPDGETILDVGCGSGKKDLMNSK